MQSGERVLAWRYGRALFAAAAAVGEENRVQQDLHAAQPALRDLAATLRHPRVAAADKKKKLEAALSGKISPLTLKFLVLLVTKKRFDLLPLVGVSLAKLVADKNNTAKAVVRAARPLSAEAQKILKDKLKLFAGRTVELEIKDDPELIGGVVVRLGDWVLDSSLRGQLRRLKENLNHGN